MARDGNFQRLVFTHLDKRGRPSAADDSLIECLNCIIDRDGTVRRRKGASFLRTSPISVQTQYRYAPAVASFNVSSTFPVSQDAEIITAGIANAELGYDDGIVGDIQAVASNLGAAGNGMSVPIGPILSGVYVDLTFSGSQIYGTRMTSRGWNNSYQSADILATNLQPGLGSRSFEVESYDTSVPGSTSNHRLYIVANGESIIQTMTSDSGSGILNGATSFGSEPVSLSGTDPDSMDIISRARLIRIHKNQMFYVSQDMPNIVYFSKTPGDGGAQRFFEFDEFNYWIAVKSGTHSPIVSLQSFGGSLYIFTTSSVWRLSGNLFDGASAKLEKVFDVGCPSQRGVAFISSTIEGTEVRDTMGRMVFVTNENEIVVTDGTAAQTVSEHVRPTLDKLTDEQISSIMIESMDENGYVCLLWPSADPTKTEGLVYDYFENRWCGELLYDFEINWIGKLRLDRGEVLMGLSPDVFDARFFYGDTNGWTRAQYNQAKGAGFILFGEDVGMDCYWRGRDDDLDAVATFVNVFDSAGTGHPVHYKLQTQTYEWNTASATKGLNNLAFEFDPVGKWDVNLQAFPDGTNVPVEAPASMIGGDDLEFGVKTTEDFRFDIAPSDPKEAFSWSQGDLVTSNYMSFGIEHEPSATGRTETIIAWEDLGAGLVQLMTEDVLCAEPGGFSLRAIEAYVSIDRTRHGYSHSAS